MQYPITHTCGHTEIARIEGPGKDRDHRATWLRSMPCLDCRRAAAKQRAIEHAGEAGLPQLIGSDKQVTWAISIRETLRTGMIALVDKAAAGSIPSPEAEAAKERIVAAMRHILDQTHAAWWIDHRFDRPQQIIQDADKALAEATK